MNVIQLINAVIDIEGDYSNHPADRGGPTRWGVTEAVARANGYDGDMKNLPRAFAVEVFNRRYVNEPGFNKVLSISSAIAEEMVDTGINMGVSWPGPWLQRILNALNQQARSFPDLVVDGQLGPATLSALRKFLDQRGADGERVIARALNCMQGARYLEITEARQANEEFFFGWMKNRVGL